jgi:hypothetical protein
VLAPAGDLPPVVAGDPVGHGVYLIAVTPAAGGLRAAESALAVAGRGSSPAPALSSHSSPRWLMASIVASVAIYALHLLAQLDAIFRHDRTLSRLDAVQLHLNGYALMAAIYLALENVALAWAPTATLAIGGVHGALAWWLRDPDRRAACTRRRWRWVRSRSPVRCDSTGRRSPWHSPSKARSSSRSA